MATIGAPGAARNRGERAALLLLLLFAFARLACRLDAKDLWLDESFSLQRAESAWPALLLGAIDISDGVDAVRTIDQHPFAYFAILGVFLRLAGDSEFALRFASAGAATLLAPAVYALARLLARRRAVPRHTPFWAALLAASSPYHLWYGQEVRMYALVALLAIISTYALLRWEENGRRLNLLAYAITASALLASHFYAALLLPVHAILIYRRLASAHRRRAIAAIAGVLALGGAAVTSAALRLALQPGAGANFASVSLRMLATDLVNAFTLGLSVDLARVWPIDVLSACLVLLAAVYGMTRRQPAGRSGWLLPAFVVIPVLSIAGLNLLRPAYMNARHMSLISGAYIVLLGGGIAWLWGRSRVLTGIAAALLLGGMAYSTANYYAAPAYDKGDLRSMGGHLRSQFQPGDLLLIEPPLWQRLFRYYLPIDEIETWRSAGRQVDWRAWPPLASTGASTVAELESITGRHRRIWLARAEPESEAATWLLSNKFRAQDWGYASPISLLKLDLFLRDRPGSEGPVLNGVEGTPAEIDTLVEARFGDKIELIGYDIAPGFGPGYAVPIALHWRAVQPIDRRYKYALRWESDRLLAITEHEPYDGLLPTTAWAPGAPISEQTTLLAPSERAPTDARLTLQVYDAETLEKLPISAAGRAAMEADGQTLILPRAPTIAEP